jgi:simple sugar transport system permease protein
VSAGLHGAAAKVAASLLPAALAILVALAVASLLILADGQAPLHVYRLFFAGTWGNPYGVGQVLFKATPLVFTGLSVALAFHAGLFNIGAEGQLVLGAFATGLAGAALPVGTPSWLALPLALGAGFVAGAAAGAVPGLLKATRGAHEVIVTIMLNFVIVAELSDLGKRFFLRESVHTAPVVAAATLARASAWWPSLRGSALNGAALLAVAAALSTWWLLSRTTAGFRLRAVGANPDAAASAGIAVGRQVVLAMALAGGLAGLVGANAVLGYKHYYEEGFSGGAGFMGIAVALLGRNHPVGIIIAALLFGTLSQGGLAVNAVVPKEIVEVLQAVIILAVAVSSAEVRQVAGLAAPSRDPV